MSQIYQLPNAQLLADLVSASDRSPSLVIRCPFDDSVLGSLPVSTRADVNVAFDEARSAQRIWQQSTTVADRVGVVRRFAALVLRNRDQLLDLIQLETGKARISAFEEVADVVEWCRYLASNSQHLLREHRRAGALPVLTKTRQRHVPKGLVGVITPWNYPFTLPVTDVLPALVSGNGVVLKPDSQTPFTALFVAHLMYRSGVPKPLLQVVVGSGRELGPVLTERSDFLMFTGATATGAQLAGQCAPRLITFSSELGGKNPMLVLQDADVERAARGAVVACFSNSGQLCVSIERIYVHQDLWDTFVPSFVELTKKMLVEPGLTWSADMGSLAGPKQLEAVSNQVSQALSVGARAVTGARSRPDLGPYFYEPTVLIDVPKGAILRREETFGPVVSLYRVASDEEAILCANDSEYGLSASVWSRRRGWQAARQLRVGTVNINEGYAAAWASHASPMGGMGLSGLGRRHGSEGLLKYTEAQTVAQQRLMPISGPAGMRHQTWANLLTTGVRVLSKLP